MYKERKTLRITKARLKRLEVAVVIIRVNSHSSTIMLETIPQISSVSLDGKKSLRLVTLGSIFGILQTTRIAINLRL